MLIIDVKVNGSQIELSQPTVASGTAGKVKLNFCFDGEWQGLAKTAVFNLPRGNILVPLEKDSCTAPAEVLAKSGRVKLGVSGTDGEKTLTSLFCSINVEHGAAASGSRAANYTPSLYEQFASKFAKFENMSVFAAAGEDALATLTEADGKLVLELTLPRGEKGDTGEKGADGVNGADGYTPVCGVDYWTEAEKKKIANDCYNYMFLLDDNGEVTDRAVYGNILSFGTEEDFETWKKDIGAEADFFCGGGQNMIVFIAGVPKYFYEGYDSCSYLPFASPMLDSEKAQIENRFGYIESAIDEIIALQEAYIGGTV